MRENIIVMVGGRSGVGKTSIIDFLVKNQGERYARPLSYTSRLKRNGEGCEEYNFISEEKMILMRDEGRFLNFDCVYSRPSREEYRIFHSREPTERSLKQSASSDTEIAEVES